MKIIRHLFLSYCLIIVDIDSMQLKNFEKNLNEFAGHQRKNIPEIPFVNLLLMISKKNGEFEK